MNAEPTNPAPLPSDFAATARNVVELLEWEVARDAHLKGHVVVFDMAPYLQGELAPRGLLNAIERRLRNLQAKHQDSEAHEAQQQAVTRLMASIRAGFELTLGRQHDGDADATLNAIREYFGSGTAFPLPWDKSRATGQEDCTFVASHVAPTDDSFVCVLFPPTDAPLGTMLQGSFDFPIANRLTTELNQLDEPMPGLTVGLHELTHCVHNKRVPVNYSSSMATRHAETVADIVPLLWGLERGQRVNGPSALEDFRTLSAGLQERRSRNTAPGLAIARLALQEAKPLTLFETSHATFTELTQQAVVYSFEALRKDYPVRNTDSQVERREAHRERGVRTKHVMRFALAALLGDADVQTMRDLVGSEFSARDAALLLRIQEAAERNLPKGATEHLQIALLECEETWPEIFNEGLTLLNEEYFGRHPKGDED